MIESTEVRYNDLTEKYERKVQELLYVQADLAKERQEKFKAS